ncbi:hypothetical protein ZWY2020_033540 [Hordeum vulgare]|nr:hypothetical protein ZWY2020_033540 [Hordeum vulgare]
MGDCWAGAGVVEAAIGGEATSGLREEASVRMEVGSGSMEHSGRRREEGDGADFSFPHCFREYTITISDVACSGFAAAMGPADGGGRATGMSAVTRVYRWQLSTSAKDLLVDVHDAGGAAAAPRQLHRREGSGTFTAGSCVVGVYCEGLRGSW